VQEVNLDLPLSRTAASLAAGPIGWRYLLGSLTVAIPVRSMTEAVHVAATAVSAAGEHADGHLRIDLRHDRVELTVQTRATGAVSERDARLARAVAESIDRIGLRAAGVTSDRTPRPVQRLEVAIDATDILAIRPFWKAVLAFADDPADDSPTGGLIDPTGQLPAVWFQPMDAPRPQRNRVHLDLTVAHDEAEGRVKAAIEAGGVLVTDEYARRFWVLADAEGNEVCVCTWADRDEWQWRQVSGAE
jgi:4a-hydroxytetrahydrobiopterin dehydratase